MGKLAFIAISIAYAVALRLFMFRWYWPRHFRSCPMADSRSEGQRAELVYRDQVAAWFLAWALLG